MRVSEPPSSPVSRRDALLDELVQLFLAEGFQQLTLGDLASRLRCSKSTLYSLGHSKEQITVNVVVRFFRTAADNVERKAAAVDSPAERIITYLQAVADELRPASPQFIADLAAHPAARAVYERNTASAAERVRSLIAEGVASGDFRAVHAAFVADVVAHTMGRIQSGGLGHITGLGDAALYDELARLVLTGVRC
jgi:AcrR family transcriptional regulator